MVGTVHCGRRGDTSQRDVPTSKVQLHLIFLAQCPGFDAAPAEITGKLGGKPVERKYSPWLYQFDVANQIVIIRVIRERKCGIDPVTIDRIWIDRPTTDYRNASLRDFFQHLRAIRARWANQNFPCNIIRIVPYVLAKRLAELLVDARHSINRAVEHRR